MFKTKYKIVFVDSHYNIFYKKWYYIDWVYLGIKLSIDRCFDAIKNHAKPVWEGYAEDINT